MKRLTGIIMLCVFLCACGKKPEVVELTPAAELNPGESVPVPEELPEPEALPGEYGLSFANLTGADIDELSISFANGIYGPVQILDKRLSDGDMVEYKDSALSAIRDPARMKLLITAKLKDGSSAEFPLLSLYDLSESVIILGKDKEGFTASLQ
ncbi:MAG: hypothetical protein IK115_06780 [Lachnospiraceae bacterium]|nr:hypothetical protein [Lachnospiraceae bacterium]